MKKGIKLKKEREKFSLERKQKDIKEGYYDEICKQCGESYTDYSNEDYEYSPEGFCSDECYRKSELKEEGLSDEEIVKIIEKENKEEELREREKSLLLRIKKDKKRIKNYKKLIEKETAIKGKEFVNKDFFWKLSNIEEQLLFDENEYKKFKAGESSGEKEKITLIPNKYTDLSFCYFCNALLHPPTPQKPVYIHEENTKGIVYVIKGTEILYSDICGDCLKEKNLLLWQILMREIGEEA